jgi:hypothetical protein
MTHTPPTTIPRCWQRPGAPGAHAWGTVDSCCLDWWTRRSRQDRRTARDCPSHDPHPPHLWLMNRLRPPQPYTMWMCGGIRDAHEG